MSIRTYKLNGKILYEAHAKIRVNGVQINRRRRELTSIAHARRVEANLRVELLRLKENPTTYTWREWADVCLSRIGIEFTPSTLANYRSHFDKWVTPVLGDKDIGDITPSDIHQIIFGNAKTIGNESKRGILKHVRRAFMIALEDGLISRNPAKGIKVKVSEKKKFVLNKTEINTLLSEGFKRNHPFYNHWVLALLTGMRSGELWALQWTDLDYESDMISVNKSWNRKNGMGPTKSSLNRTVPMSGEAKRFLKQLQAESVNITDPILERLTSWNEGLQAQILRDFCNDVGITPIRFHDLRATFITQLLLQGVPVAKVMATVGHSQLKTTMVYLRMVGNDVKGVTEALNITLPRYENNGNIVSIFKNNA